MTGAIAAAGALFFAGADPHAFALVEGLAAGAMLTMIAETMLPEAYFKGGSVVGLSTLFGFLVAIYSKTLESPGTARHGPPALRADAAAAAPAPSRATPASPGELRPPAGAD
jgi:hypothetical protein